MFGGMSKAGWATILAGGMMLGSSVSAQAADLGGDCCADLEERVAELEATTARKGNRKVSLSISGYVDKAVMYWDDGQESNSYVVDNDFAQSRVQIAGKAKIAKGWTAGYRLEIGFDNASSDSVSQFSHSGAALGAFSGTAGAPSFMELRQNHWYIESEHLGKVSVGLLSGAQDDLYKWGNVGKAYSDAELHYNGKFFLKQSGSTNYTTLIWDNVANNLDNSRVNAVRYDTPEIAGFMVSASWGEDDIWDVAIRFEKKFGDIHVKAGASYYDDNQPAAVNGARDEANDFVATFGISDKHSGLYFYGAYGHRDFDEQPAGFTDSAKYYYGQVGINRQLIELGNTNFHVDYGRYDDWGAGSGFDVLAASTLAAGTNPAGSTHTVKTSEVTRYGFGVTQNIKAAEMDVYAVFNHYEADITTTTTPVELEDWYAVAAGARINF